MHPEMMKPHIPLLAPGSSLIWIASLASSSALRPSHLPLLSLSALFFSYFFFFFSQFNHFKAGKGNNCTSFWLIIEHLLSIVFINLDM